MSATGCEASTVGWNRPSQSCQIEGFQSFSLSISHNFFSAHCQQINKIIKSHWIVELGLNWMWKAKSKHRRMAIRRKKLWSMWLQGIHGRTKRISVLHRATVWVRDRILCRWTGTVWITDCCNCTNICFFEELVKNTQGNRASNLLNEPVVVWASMTAWSKFNLVEREISYLFNSRLCTPAPETAFT